MAGSTPVQHILTAPSAAQACAGPRGVMTDNRHVTPPLVLLDLDGTLTDSAPGILASVTLAYRALGLPVPSPTELRTFVGPPIPVSLRAHGVPESRVAEALAAYRVEFEAGGMFDNSVYPGIREALKTLRAASWTLAVATSKPEVYARRICDRFALTGLVDGVYGASLDESRGTKAAVIGHALASLGAAVPERARIVMVGDREHDVLGAAVHGIACLGAEWGYAVPGELDRAGAIGIIATPADLADAVVRFSRPAGRTPVTA